MKNNEEHGERVSFIGSLAAVECKWVLGKTLDNLWGRDRRIPYGYFNMLLIPHTVRLLHVVEEYKIQENIVLTIKYRGFLQSFPNTWANCLLLLFRWALVFDRQSDLPGKCGWLLCNRGWSQICGWARGEYRESRSLQSMLNQQKCRVKNNTLGRKRTRNGHLSSIGCKGHTTYCRIPSIDRSLTEVLSTYTKLCRVMSSFPDTVFDASWPGEGCFVRSTEFDLSLWTEQFEGPTCHAWRRASGCWQGRISSLGSLRAEKLGEIWDGIPAPLEHHFERLWSSRKPFLDRLSAMSCCVMLCYTMLCYVMLCHVILCNVA